ncbi:MAG: hypothetical protein RI907_303, partial [Pseudomonadota bacterium]
MSRADGQVDLPDAVLNVMGRLERWMGRITVRRAVTSILLTGLCLTSLAVSVVFWAEQHRERQALQVTGQRLQGLIRTQVEHELALVNQLADWASYQSFDGDRGSAWHSSGGALIGPDALHA